MALDALGPAAFAVLPALLAVAVWAVVDLERFLMVVVVAALLLPQPLIVLGGAQIAAGDVALGVACLAWLARGAVGRAPQPYLHGNPFLVPGLVFVSYNLLSLLWSDDPAATTEFSIQLFEIVVVFPLVFASVPRTPGAVRLGMLTFVAATSALAVYAALAVSPTSDGPLAATSGIFGGLNKNVLGSYVAAGLIMAVGLLIVEERRRWRLLLGVAVLVELVGLLATVSRGSIIGGLVATLAVALLLERGRRQVALLTAVAAVGYLLVVGTGSTADLTQDGSYDSSVVRTYSIADAVEKIKADPLTGTGAAAYISYIPELQITLPDPNNMLLLTFAELGIGGLLALLFLLNRWLALLWRVRLEPPELAGPAVAAGCVTLSLFVHFQFDVTWTRGTTTLAFAMIGVVIAAQRMGREVDPSRRRRPEPVVPRQRVGVAR